MATIKRFEDLDSWREARLLTAAVYKVTKTNSFAKDFGLRDQIRRACVSIMSNIAEGYERGGHAEFQRYLIMAKGSAGEVRAQLYVALDEGYISEENFSVLKAIAERISRMVAGLVRYLGTLKKSKRAGETKP